MNAVDLSEFQQFSNEKMKKNNVFQTPRFFCDIYCFEPGQEQKGHTHVEQDKVYLVLQRNKCWVQGRGPWRQPEKSTA
jgi:hypothetical protein